MFKGNQHAENIAREREFPYQFLNYPRFLIHIEDKNIFDRKNKLVLLTKCIMKYQSAIALVQAVYCVLVLLLFFIFSYIFVRK